MTAAMRFTFGDLVAVAQAMDAVDRLKAELAEFAAENPVEPNGLVEFLDVATGDAFDIAPQKAIEYFKAKGLRTTFSYADMVGLANDASFTVAKMMDVDLLGMVRESLDMALANGVSFNEWRKGLEPTLKAAGWWGEGPMLDPLTGQLETVRKGSAWRLQTIFRTNLQTAYSAGMWKQIELQTDVAPYLMYDAVDDFRTREAHRAWDGTVLDAGSIWWKTHMPPNGWNCRCSVIQLDAEQLEALGIPPGWKNPPDDGSRNWENPRTGEVLSVPNGVDPGFDRNPGRSMAPDLRELLIEKVKNLQPDMLDAAAVSIQRSIEGAKVPPDLVAGTARLRTAQAAYERVFQRRAPDPLGVAPLGVAIVIEQSIVDGEPIADAYDWWTKPRGTEP